jgi:hypothetical protein
MYVRRNGVSPQCAVADNIASQAIVFRENWVGVTQLKNGQNCGEGTLMPERSYNPGAQAVRKVIVGRCFCNAR